MKFSRRRLSRRLILLSTAAVLGAGAVLGAWLSSKADPILGAWVLEGTEFRLVFAPDGKFESKRDPFSVAVSGSWQATSTPVCATGNLSYSTSSTSGKGLVSNGRTYHINLDNGPPEVNEHGLTLILADGHLWFPDDPNYSYERENLLTACRRAIRRWLKVPNPSSRIDCWR